MLLLEDFYGVLGRPCHRQTMNVEGQDAEEDLMCIGCEVEERVYCLEGLRLPYGRFGKRLNSLTQNNQRERTDFKTSK